MISSLICLVAREVPRIAWLSGASDRYAEDFRKGLRGFLYNRCITVRRDGSHIVTQKLELIQSLVGKTERRELHLEICLTENETASLSPIFQKEGRTNRRVIGLIPGAGIPMENLAGRTVCGARRPSDEGISRRHSVARRKE